jgi:hypothetical protein
MESCKCLVLQDFQDGDGFLLSRYGRFLLFTPFPGCSLTIHLQGILTCVLAVIGFIVLVDFPDKAHNSKWFLNARELRFVIARINADRADAIPEPFTWSSYLDGAIDLKVWGFAWLFGMSTTVSYALAYFL